MLEKLVDCPGGKGEVKEWDPGPGFDHAPGVKCVPVPKLEVTFSRPGIGEGVDIGAVEELDDILQWLFMSSWKYRIICKLFFLAFVGLS